MENRDIDNLQRTTKDYAESSWWLRNIVIGAIATIIGIVQLLNPDLASLLIFAFIASAYFIDKYLRRFVMQKGLGQVKQKGEITSFKQKLSRQQVLFLIFIMAFCSLPMFFMEKKILLSNIFFPGLAILAFISGLVSRMRTFFYLGAYTLICAFVWIYPLGNIFHASENVSLGIIYITIGFGLLVSGIILFPKYKKIVQKVKTNE